MSDINAPAPEPDDTLGPDDVIGGGNAVAGGNPAQGASQQVQAPPPQQGQPQQGGAGDMIGAGAGGQQGDNTQKDPQQWVTGDEPMTGAQRSYLETLAQEAGETLPGDLTKAQASEHIDRLQQSTGRGQS